MFYQLYADDYPKRQKDLDQLKTIMAGYDDLQSFIDDTALDPPESELQADSGGEKLILSTIHSSKGLEFDVVFVIGLAEGRFPHGAGRAGRAVEEERRLLYVAATRARKHLYLTYPRELMTPDRQYRRVGISPFLARDFSRALRACGARSLILVRSAFAAPGESRRGYPLPQEKAKRLTMDDFDVDTRVRHPFFGAGGGQEAVAPTLARCSFRPSWGEDTPP